MNRRTRTALVSALAACPLMAATPAQAEADAPTIATYNAFLMPTSLYPNWGQEIRADLINEDGVLEGADVVVLQELFDDSSAETLRSGLSEELPHGTPIVGESEEGWDDSTGLRPGAATNGGVSVHSAWPIVRAEQHVFSEACGADRFSAKGFVHTEIDSPDGPLHVFGTHMQSEDSLCASGEDERVRTAQLEQILAAVEEAGIPEGEQIHLAGDLNIIGGTEEWENALELLDAVEPVGTGDAVSWDPQGNSIAGHGYPDWEAQQLDHVLPIRNGAEPEGFANHTAEVKSEPWTVTSWGQEYTYDDYSDHYPVFGSPVAP
ncbi:sphingomyelin phosphodiesterase [Nocardiopsis coralli]|nr:sphingomyelin phosphodiesterase [Nocardiopsis coralli]